VFVEKTPATVPEQSGHEGKALVEDEEPFHTIIALFIVRNGEAIKNLFMEILYFCNELMLIGESCFRLCRGT
jgi:hypothetical protein